MLFAACSLIPKPNETQEVLWASQLYVRQKNPKKAKKLIFKNLQKFPGNLDLHMFYQEHFSSAVPEYVYILSKTTHTTQQFLKIRLMPHSLLKAQKLQSISNESIAPWVYFELARTFKELGEIKTAAGHIKKTIELRPDWVQARELKAFIALLQVNWASALAEARYQHKLDPNSIKPYFFEAANHLLYSDNYTAIRIMRQVQLQFPHYSFATDEKSGYQSAYWREIQKLMSQEQYNIALKVVTEACQLFPKQPVFWAMKAEILLELGEKAHLQAKRALSLDPYLLRAVKAYRRILFQQKSYKKGFRLWQKIVPAELLYHPQNKLRLRYLKLQDTIANYRPNNNASKLQLARALVKIGWEYEAKSVYEHTSGKVAAKEHAYLQKHIVFLKGLKQYIYGYYGTLRKSIVEVLDDIGRIARSCGIELHTSTSKEFNTFFVVVREADPFSWRKGSLQEYLANYNKFLDIGNNYGYLEFRLMNRIVLQQYQRKIFGKATKYEVVIGDETYIDTFVGFHSGSPTVAGRAFLSRKGFYIALDAIRPSTAHLKEIQLRLSQPVAIPKNFSLPKREFVPYIEWLATALLQRSLKKEWLPFSKSSSKWDKLYELFLMRRIDTVHNHELGHINDFTCFLPLSKNILNILHMGWQQRFSAQKIQARFEHVAEIFGLSHTRYPFFYLYQEMERLDSSFEGIFHMVYWAWYGRLPQDDPYYRSASRIYAHVLKRAGKGLVGISKAKLKKILQELSFKEGIVKRCE